MVTSFDIGSEADPCSKIGEMFVGLAAGQPFRGKILARIRQCIARTALRPVATLPSSPEWLEMAALVRLDLPLSFDTRPHLYLPEIFHVIVSLCGVGTFPVRRSVYALTINTIHALARDPESDEEVLDRVLVVLGSGEGRLLFGLPSDLSDTTSVQEWDVSTSGDKLVAVLLGVIESAAPSLGEFFYASLRPPNPAHFYFPHQTRPTHGERDGRVWRPPPASSTTRRCKLASSSCSPSSVPPLSTVISSFR
jgi:neurofibromin 1